MNWAKDMLRIYIPIDSEKRTHNKRKRSASAKLVSTSSAAATENISQKRGGGALSDARRQREYRQVPQPDHHVGLAILRHCFGRAEGLDWSAVAAKKCIHCQGGREGGRATNPCLYPSPLERERIRPPPSPCKITPVGRRDFANPVPSIGAPPSACAYA